MLAEGVFMMFGFRGLTGMGEGVLCQCGRPCFGLCVAGIVGRCATRRDEDEDTE
jgi:hypothetical protein